MIGGRRQNNGLDFTTVRNLMTIGCANMLFRETIQSFKYSPSDHLPACTSLVIFTIIERVAKRITNA
jgi:hypothetical protein